MSEIFQLRLRVYFQDTDAGGIVYHANYLSFAERGRTEALRELGIPHAEMLRQHGIMFVVRHVNIDYQRPARLDDELIVETRIMRVGGASATLRQNVMRDSYALGSESLVVLQISLACARVADGKAARMPEAWRTKLQAALE